MNYENLRSIKIKNYDNYLLYENGDIINTKTNRKMEISLDSSKNTHRVRLNKETKTTTFNALRLIYEKFNNVELTTNEIIKLKNEDLKNKFHFTNLVKINRKDIRKNENHKELDKTKEWKIIKNYSDYKISNYGDIFSIKSNKMLHPALDGNGYYRATLISNDNKRRYISPHRLLYDTFKGINDENNVIDHIDRNKTNNNINNLREASLSENAKNCEKKKQELTKIHQYSLENKFIKEWKSINEIKVELGFGNQNIFKCYQGKIKNAHGFIWKNPKIITDLNGFVEVNTKNNNKFSDYKINKQGIIINKKNIILMQSIHSGYNRIGLKNDDGKTISLYVHKLIGQTFLDNPNDYEIINHIDENKLNNNIENLEWVTHAQNIIHSCGKKVNKINMKTDKILKTYNSINEAVIDVGKNNNGNIMKVLSKKRNSAHGFKWEYVK